MFSYFFNYSPPPTVIDEGERSRYRHFNTCVLLTVFTMLVIVLGNKFFNFYQVRIIAAFFLATFGLLFIGFYKNILSLNKAANIYIGSGTCFVTLSAYVSGGFKSPVLFWYTLVPLYAFWLLNRRYAWIWFLIAVALPILFLFLDDYKLIFHDYYDYFKGDNRYYALIIILFLIMNIFIVGNEFENNKTRSIKEVNLVNEELRDTLTKLELIKKDLEEAEKHKDQFIAQMSHEMRTPMNAIIGVSELLKDTSDDTAELLRILDTSSKNLLYIIDDILDITKIRTGKFHYQQVLFELRPVLQDVYNTNKLKAQEKEITLTLILDDLLPAKVIGDSYRITQILNNLLGNAIKFTEKGEVRLAVTYDKRTRSIIYTVTDTGIGMSETEVTKVFDIFSQANSEVHLKYGGTGMGLSITRQLVELFNGEIHIKSKVSNGTIVTVRLPTNRNNFDSQPNDREENETGFVKADLSDLKILVADDNEVNQLIIKKLLQSDTPSVHIDFASNGDEVLSLITQSPYDIVLMDVQMPAKNGLETTRIIRAHQDRKIRDLKIIALTAFARQAEAENCLASGMNDYASKPIIKEELIRKITRLTAPA